MLLRKIDTDINMDRYYSIQTTKDLFGQSGVERRGGAMVQISLVFGWWERRKGKRQTEDLPRPKPKQSKQKHFVTMLTNGARIAQLTKSLKVQPHTFRAAISELRKSGSTVEQSSVDGQ